MAQFEQPQERIWETPEETVKNLLAKREKDTKNFTSKDEEKLEYALKRIEEINSSSDQLQNNKEKKGKDSHFPEHPGNYL